MLINSLPNAQSILDKLNNSGTNINRKTQNSQQNLDAANNRFRD